MPEGNLINTKVPMKAGYETALATYVRPPTAFCNDFIYDI